MNGVTPSHVSCPPRPASFKTERSLCFLQLQLTDAYSIGGIRKLQFYQFWKLCPEVEPLGVFDGRTDWRYQAEWIIDGEPNL